LIAKVSRVNKKLLNLKKKNLGVFLTGFTMIELLIAIAVFMIGIMAAFSLSLHNLNTTKENANRVIAADLAREGIETVRNIRDSNWLAREANVMSGGEVVLWYKDLGSSKVFSTVNYDTNTLVAIVSPVSDLDAAMLQDSTKLYIKDGFYKHDYATPPTGQPTAFRRAIRLQAICLTIKTSPTKEVSEDVKTSINTFFCGESNVNISFIKIGMQITSRVQYTYGSRTNTIEAVEKIYNWRQ